MLTDIFLSGWIVLQVLIGYNLVLPLVLYLFYQIKPKAGKSIVLNTDQGDYGIIITAYEQTFTLPAVVESVLKLNHQNYLVYVVADKCDISNLKFDDDRVILLRPETALSGNTRSHFYAIDHFKRDHKRLTIIDSDNLVHPEYLNELDAEFNKGFRAVQGLREAKNFDTTLACLDAGRDIYYHFYDGKLLFELCSSATLSGSGMAFETSLYKECLEKLDVNGAGFDKVLQAEILKRNIRIAFAPKAIVYDEKTSDKDQLVNQRSRWINTWFKYFKYGFLIFTEGLKNFSLNQLLFGTILLRPPLFIFLFLSAICMALNLFINPLISMVWFIGFVLFVLGFIVSLKKSHTDNRIYNSLAGIPKFMFLQVISLLNARNANRRSVATKHFHKVSLDDITQQK